MRTLFAGTLAALTLLTSAESFAAATYLCEGKDLEGNAVEIKGAYSTGTSVSSLKWEGLGETTSSEELAGNYSAALVGSENAKLLISAILGNDAVAHISAEAVGSEADDVLHLGGYAKAEIYRELDGKTITIKKLALIKCTGSY